MYCTTCGKPNKETARFCKSCGNPLGTDNEDSSPGQMAETSRTRISTPVVPDPQWATVVQTPVQAPPARVVPLMTVGTHCPACQSALPPGSRWCPLCHSSTLDPSFGRLASPVKRLFATILDMVVPLVLLFLVFGLCGASFVSVSAGGGSTLSSVFGVLDGLLMVAFLITYVVSNWLLFSRGTTPGKRLLGMTVIQADGRHPGFFLMLIRETIGRWISSLCFSLGNLWILLDKERQAWHDKLASTYVVDGRAPDPATVKYARAPLYPAAALIIFLLFSSALGATQTHHYGTGTTYQPPSTVTTESTTGSTNSTGGGSAAGSSNTPPSVAPVTSWAPYTQGVYLTLDYPATWQVSVVRPGNYGRTQINSASPDLKIVVDAERAKDRDSMIDGRYWDKEFQRKFPGAYHLISLERNNLAGLDGSNWIFTRRKDDGGEVTINETLFHRRGTLYTLMFKTPSEAYNSWTGDWNHVLSSCRFAD